MMANELPDVLLWCFADSRVSLESYSRESRRLVFRVEKEIGLEVGLITFQDVSFITTAESFSGDGINAVPFSELTREFYARYPACRDSVESDDIAFQFYDQEGSIHTVVAKTIQYKKLT